MDYSWINSSGNSKEWNNEGKKWRCKSFFIIISFAFGILSGAAFALYAKRIVDNGITTYVGNTSFHWQDPPPHNEFAKVARYVLHISDWGSLSTFSTHKGIENYPFVNVFSVSDGTITNSSGVPYFYISEFELSVKDINVNKRVSFTVSLQQSNYCKKNNYDPEDPRCAHIIFTGDFLKVKQNSSEEIFARQALFSRHPEMPDWPKGHHWFFAKINIIHIYVLDFFGGANVVDVEEYFKNDPF